MFCVGVNGSRVGLASVLWTYFPFSFGFCVLGLFC